MANAATIAGDAAAGGQLPGAGGWWPNASLTNPAAYGGVPAPSSPQQAQGGSIAGNLGNVALLNQLAQGVGGASGAGGAANLNTALPGATAAQETSLANINSDLAGVLSPDVIAQLSQQAAERGVATGSIGSPNSNAALMRLLGLTSTGLQQTGASELNALTAAAPTGPQFNPASMLVTPEQQLQAEQYNAQLAAAPNPGAAAAANLAALNAGRGGGGGGMTLPSATPGSPQEAAFMASGQYDPAPTIAYGPSYGTNPATFGALGANPYANIGASPSGLYYGANGNYDPSGGTYYAGDQAGAPAYDTGGGDFYAGDYQDGGDYFE